MHFLDAARDASAGCRWYPDGFCGRSRVNPPSTDPEAAAQSGERD